MIPHAQAYFCLCIEAFERLYRAVQVMSSGSAKGQLMDKNVLGAILDCVGRGASESNVSFLGCIYIFSTLCWHQLQTKQKNRLCLFQEFLMGDSQNSYFITFCAAVETLSLQEDLTKFTETNVNGAEVRRLRSKIQGAIKSVHNWLRKVNFLDIRNLSPIELKVMEDLATVTRGILQLWTEQHDRYDVLKKASEDDKAAFVLENLGIDQEAALLTSI